MKKTLAQRYTWPDELGLCVPHFPSVNESLSSPLPLAWPQVYMILMPEEELRDDVDRLLTALLPAGRVEALVGGGQPAFGASIGNNGRLRYVRRGLSAAWRDAEALSTRLDELVARDRVRAVAQAEPTTVRRSDGIHDWTYDAIHVLVEHRELRSYDFIWPLAWGEVHRPDAHEPQFIDRIAAGYPHRIWPGVAEPTVETVTAVSSEKAEERYLRYGEYDQLHRAISIAEVELKHTEDDFQWATRADRLASLLATRFRHSGGPQDIEAALVLGREAVTRGGERPLLRAHYAALLGLGFVAEGRLEVLARAIDAAIALPPGDDVVEVAEILGELLLLSYRATAEQHALDQALSTLQAATALLQESGAEPPARLAAALGDAHLAAFDRTGDREHLDAGLVATARALKSTTERPELPRRLRAHALARLRLFEDSGESSQLQFAHVGLREALNLTHDKAPDRTSLLLDLASVRAHRLPRELAIEILEADGLWPAQRGVAERLGIEPSHTFLFEAINRLNGFVPNMPDDSPERPRAFAVRAALYRDLYYLGRGADRDIEPSAHENSTSSASLDLLREVINSAAQGAQDWAASFAAAPIAQKLGIAATGAELYELAVDALLELADRDPAAEAWAHGRAFELAEAAKSRLLAERLGHADVLAPRGVPKRLIERERSLLAELVNLDTAALAARDSGIPLRPNSERRERLTRELDQVWVSIADRGLAGAEYVGVRRGQPLELMQIREVIIGGDSGTAVLSLFVLDQRTALFLARADDSGFGVDHVPVDRRAWADASRRYERELPGSFGRDLLPPTWEVPLRPLLEKATERVRGCAHLVVVPHGPAHGFPWMYLTRFWESPRGGPPSVSTVPSLATLDRLRRRPQSRTDDRFVIGNPTGDLPHAEDEAKAVGAVLGVEPLLRAHAVPDALDAAAPTARVLHLACHAAFDRDSPLDSHIVLFGGRWRARDALSHRLDADLVVLSGCETGAAGALAGEELAGLAEAFLHAGSRAVIVSLWRVSDAATADLMRELHRQLSDGTPAPSALRSAAESVRAVRSHPWYWASFELVGGEA